MPNKKTNSAAEKDLGVLYIRYDKNTLPGQAVERFKRKSGRNVSRVALNLIFLCEVVEPSDFINNTDLETLDSFCYESLKMFSNKLGQAKSKIETIRSDVIRREYEKAVSSSDLRDNQSNILPREIYQDRSEI